MKEIEIGEYSLQHDQIVQYVQENLKPKKRIYYYRQFFDKIMQQPEFDITQIALLFYGPIELSIHCEALEQKWIVTGRVTEEQRRFSLRSLASIKCVSAASCHASIRGGRKRYRGGIIQKRVGFINSYGYPYSKLVAFRHISGDKTDETVQHILEKTSGCAPLPCRDCQYRMRCLLDPNADETFVLRKKNKGS